MAGLLNCLIRVGPGTKALEELYMHDETLQASSNDVLDLIFFKVNLLTVVHGYEIEKSRNSP